MQLKYRQSESTVRPEEVEVCANTVYLRKDIEEVVREDDEFDGEPQKMWTYQEAAVPKDEFNQNAGALMIAAQKTGDGDRLAIMEALADLYDVMATVVATL